MALTSVLGEFPHDYQCRVIAMEEYKVVLKHLKLKKE
jgi:hypothetical protein